MVLTQARDRVTGTLSLSPPLASPSSAVSGAIAELGSLTLDGTIISTPSTGASTTLGALADCRVQIEPVTASEFLQFLGCWHQLARQLGDPGPDAHALKGLRPAVR